MSGCKHRNLGSIYISIFDTVVQKAVPLKTRQLTPSNMSTLLRHLYLVCICFIALAGVPLVPRKLDHLVPIPIDGLSWHELLESMFMYLLSLAIFSLYYMIVTFNRTSVPSVWSFVPILLSLLMSMEGNGIHWSCNAIHSTFNPGNERGAIRRAPPRYDDTYIQFVYLSFADDANVSGSALCSL